MAKSKKISRSVSFLKIKRALFHIAIGLAILWISVNFSSYVRWFLFLLLAGGILISLASLRFELPFVYSMLKIFEKPRYIRKFPGKGVLFFVAGCLLVLKIFPYGTALASIAIMTFADPVATLLGFFFGKRSHKKPFNTLKKIEGTIAGIAAGTLAALFFVSPIKALVASSLAMLAEALTLQLGGDDVDDNIAVPVVAASALHLLNKFLPLL